MLEPDRNCHNSHPSLLPSLRLRRACASLAVALSLAVSAGCGFEKKELSFDASRGEGYGDRDARSGPERQDRRPGADLKPCSMIGDCYLGEKCEAVDPAKPDEKFCVPVCETSLDCPQAYVCIDGQCVQQECNEVTVCPGRENEETFCAPAGVEPKQPDKQFCSPIQCKNNQDCEKYGAGYVCNEYLDCVAGSTVDVIAFADVVHQPDEYTPPEETSPCTACVMDSDCGDLKCYALGGGTFCFGPCKTNDDCATGWMCYELSNEGKQCIPLSFGCNSDCLAAECPVGEICDQESGQCVKGGDKCAPCTLDWDCMDGLRCYQDGKYCAPACVNDACQQNAVCQQVNTIPVNLCISNSPACCYGSDCQACPAAKPYPCGGECCECTSDNHCPQGESCTNDTCSPGPCTDPAKPHLCLDGACHECCTSVACADQGAGCVCNKSIWKCECAQPEECTFCPPSYPACTQINGIWSCVQCTDDSYCANESTCDLGLYSCSGAGSCTGCTNDSECFSSLEVAPKCDPGAGCCYDPGGWCDGVESFCNAPAGSECEGLMDFLGGGLPIPGMPTGMAVGVCTCTEPMDMMSLLMCLMGGCSAGGCYGETVCVEPSILGQLLGGGGMPLPDGEGFCVNMTSLLDGLLGGV